MNHQKDIATMDESSPGKKEGDENDSISNISPSKRENIIYQPMGFPEDDGFQIFIKSVVLKQIKLSSEGRENSYGILYGNHRLHSISPFIEILECIPTNKEYSTAVYLKAEEMAFQKNLSVLGWYKWSMKIKEKMSLDDKHIHYMHFYNPWEVALFKSFYGNISAFFGWKNDKPVKFNGYFIFEEKEKEEFPPYRSRNETGLKIQFHRHVIKEIYNYTRDQCRGWFSGYHESGGILLGKSWDKDNKRVTISRQIPAINAQSGRTHLTFTHDAWARIYKEMNKYPDLEILGWYHSHPGFSVFLSTDDRFIHREFFKKPHHIALVIDPVYKRLACFGWDGDQIVEYKYEVI